MVRGSGGGGTAACAPHSLHRSRPSGCLAVAFCCGAVVDACGCLPACLPDHLFCTWPPRQRLVSTLVTLGSRAVPSFRTSWRTKHPCTAGVRPRAVGRLTHGRHARLPSGGLGPVLPVLPSERAAGAAAGHGRVHRAGARCIDSFDLFVLPATRSVSLRCMQLQRSQARCMRVSTVRRRAASDTCCSVGALLCSQQQHAVFPHIPPPLQELAARIIQAGERPDIDPKAVVLWVGTNNVKNPNKGNADPADKLDWCARAVLALCCCIRECRELAAVKGESRHRYARCGVSAALLRADAEDAEADWSRKWRLLDHTCVHPFLLQADPVDAVQYARHQAGGVRADPQRCGELPAVAAAAAADRGSVAADDAAAKTAAASMLLRSASSCGLPLGPAIHALRSPVHRRMCAPPTRSTRRWRRRGVCCSSTAARVGVICSIHCSCQVSRKVCCSWTAARVGASCCWTILMDDLHACTAWQPLAGPLLGPHQAATHAACLHFNTPAPQQWGSARTACAQLPANQSHYFHPQQAWTPATESSTRMARTCCRQASGSGWSACAPLCSRCWTATALRRDHRQHCSAPGPQPAILGVGPAAAAGQQQHWRLVSF